MVEERKSVMFKLFKLAMSAVKAVIAINVAITAAVTAVTVAADINRRNKKVDMSTVAPTKEYPVIRMDTPHIAAATKNGLGESIIITNKLFDHFSFDTKKAVIQHEVGHHVLGHLDNELSLMAYNNLRSIYPFVGHVISIELEADAYAASVVGNECMINALKELKALFNLPDHAKKEIDLRIKALGGQA